MKKILYYFLPVASMLLPAACTTEEDFGGGTVPPGDGFTIEAVCQNMLPQQVVTRSAIAKDDKEKRINQLYLFFFDENGDYLESSNTKVFSPYMAPSANTTNVSIPTDVFKDPAFAKKTTIYALANVTPEVVTDANGDGYPDNFPQYSKDGKKPKELLEAFVYDPANYTPNTRDDITTLPSTGMPMAGKSATVNLTEKGSLTMQLKALMARIDINISIDSDHSDESGQLPRLSIAEWGVYNMPTAVPLTEPADGQTSLTTDEPYRNVENIQSDAVVYNHGGAASLTFYMSTDTHLATGQKWTAGNGKRKYFTTDLVTNTLAQNTEYTISRSRDRIYFYLDENLSTKDRTATVNISYTDNNTQTPRTRTIEIVQHGLLPVQWYYEGRLQGTIYVEAYEEYISHYDPLNEFEGDYIYDGLEWGCNGEYIGGPLNNEWTEGNKHGAAATRRIITQAGQSEMNLNEKPRSAAEYCYNKNKRNANGAVQGMSNSSGWFLPGISQLESILTSYYNTYTEFQNNFYWSSAAAKDRTGIWPAYIYPESTSYARATKALPDGGYAESDWDDIYTNDNGTTGKAPRINRPLRIRAAYVPPSGVTIQ